MIVADDALRVPRGRRLCRSAVVAVDDAVRSAMFSVAAPAHRRSSGATAAALVRRRSGASGGFGPRTRADIHP